MADAGTMTAERPREPEPLAAPPMATPAEPATPRALWPTFMRRTLCEETLRHVPGHVLGHDAGR